MSIKSFKKCAAAPTHSVNYLWLCAKGPRKTFPDYATRLPLHNFERVYANAARYPSAEFNLWLDSRQTTYLDRYFLDSHRYAFDAGNVQVRDLCKIPKYKELAGFEPDSNLALYARADCARVLILDYLLNRESNQTVIYSDLDCEDVSLHNEQAAAALAKYGLAYGRSGRHPICNGYIALQGERGKTFMEDSLLPRTLRAFQKNHVNHFGAFACAVQDHRKSCGEKFRLGVIDLPPMRMEMFYDESIYRKVSPRSPTRIPGSYDFI